MNLRGLFIVVGVALAFVFLAIGCAPPNATVTHQGGYKVDVNVKHEPQKTDIWIHRDRRKRSNQAQKQENQ